MNPHLKCRLNFICIYPVGLCVQGSSVVSDIVICIVQKVKAHQDDEHQSKKKKKKKNKKKKGKGNSI